MSIDYKSEVLRVFPDAVCNYEYYHQFDEYGYEVVSGRNLLSFGNVGELYAWQSAYNNLVKQNKITPPTNDKK